MLNFSQEQIDGFQKWKKEFHDEITRYKKKQEQKGYSNQRTNFYKWLCKIEKAIDEVEITTPSEAKTSLSNYTSTVNTEIKFGGLLERYLGEITKVVFHIDLELFYRSEAGKMRSFASSKIIELRKMLDLFD